MSVCGQRYSASAASTCSPCHFTSWRSGTPSARPGSTGNAHGREEYMPGAQGAHEREAHHGVHSDDRRFETSLDAIATIIRSCGHEVITAGNEEDACRCCERHGAPDLLILDVKLRGPRSGPE